MPTFPYPGTNSRECDQTKSHLNKNSQGYSQEKKKNQNHKIDMIYELLLRMISEMNSHCDSLSNDLYLRVSYKNYRLYIAGKIKLRNFTHCWPNHLLLLLSMALASDVLIYCPDKFGCVLVVKLCSSKVCLQVWLLSVAGAR